MEVDDQKLEMKDNEVKCNTIKAPPSDEIINWTNTDVNYWDNHSVCTVFTYILQIYIMHTILIIVYLYMYIYIYIRNT